MPRTRPLVSIALLSTASSFTPQQLLCHCKGRALSQLDGGKRVLALCSAQSREKVDVKEEI